VDPVVNRLVQVGISLWKDVPPTASGVVIALHTKFSTRVHA